MSDLAVIVPTLRRPESLARALASLAGQVGVDGRLREIVVVDNDPAASARDAVEAARAAGPWRVISVHAPEPGVATARNAGLAATGAPLIAFLDDDEEARPDWLARLVEVHERFGADVTFSAIVGAAPDAPLWLRPYLERFFSRQGPDRSGPIARTYGCGASLMTRATALPGAAPFDTAADQTGGEDDRLFAGLARSGARFAWAAEAIVVERAPPERATLAYALRRAFAYGKGPCETAARERRAGALVGWTAVGLAQTLIWGAAALAAFAMRSPARPFAYDRLARGLGKVLWWTGAEAFYGRAVLARSGAASL